MILFVNKNKGILFIRGSVIQKLQEILYFTGNAIRSLFYTGDTK